MLAGNNTFTGTLPIGLGLHLFGRARGFKLEGTGATDSITQDTASTVTLLVGATDSKSGLASPPIVEVGATDSTLQDAASTIALLVGATDSESGLASPPAVEVGATDSKSGLASPPPLQVLATDSESNQAGPPIVEVGATDSTLQDAASTIALLVGATDSESGLASPPAVEVGATDSESNQAGPPVVEVGVKEVDGIITLAFVPNLQMRITPHALKILSGVQVIRFKEADSLPNIVFTLIDSQCVQIPLPDNTELYFRASDRETLTEEVYQQLVEIEDSYVLDGATLSPLEPKDYSCEVVVIYNSTLVMTSETFNLDVVKNLNY